jgi:hypothetical protein
MRWKQNEFGVVRFSPFTERQMMPRPKSEYTKSGKTIAVRATMSEWIEWKKLGGAKWLRPILRQSIAATQQPKEPKQ